MPDMEQEAIGKENFFKSDCWICPTGGDINTEMIIKLLKMHNSMDTFLTGLKHAFALCS